MLREMFQNLRESNLGRQLRGKEELLLLVNIFLTDSGVSSFIHSHVYLVCLFMLLIFTVTRTKLQLLQVSPIYIHFKL